MRPPRRSRRSTLPTPFAASAGEVVDGNDRALHLWHRLLPSSPVRGSADLLLLSGQEHVSFAERLPMVEAHIQVPPTFGPFEPFFFGRREHLAPVSYTHLRAHETRHDLVCRLLLEKKK